MILDFVSGKMTTGERNQKLLRLKNSSNNERSLLSNARCLSEGIDVPSLDGVAFIDPKRSEIDIVQAVGRALRLSKATGKKYGYVLLPIFIPKIGIGKSPICVIVSNRVPSPQ